MKRKKRQTTAWMTSSWISKRCLLFTSNFFSLFSYI
jgi:hypothetical protein